MIHERHLSRKTVSAPLIVLIQCAMLLKIASKITIPHSLGKMRTDEMKKTKGEIYKGLLSFN